MPCERWPSSKERSMKSDEQQLKKKWAERDRVTRAITKDGLFRASVIHNPMAVRSAHERHGLDPLRTLMLGRALAGASLMASFLKGEERVVIVAEGDGQVKTVYAEALQVGEVRGYAVNNKAPEEGRQSPIGEGLLKVQRVLYGKQEPVTGIVELQRGDIASDLSHYLTQSEQIPSTFMFDMSFDEHDVPKQSVGLLMQAMPGARPEDIFKVYDTLDYLDRLTEFADKGYTPEDILRQVMPGDIDVLSSTPVDFFCRCSLDRFKSILLTIGYEEVSAMQAEGQNELSCQYCNEKYLLSDEDFTELKEQLLARRN